MQKYLSLILIVCFSAFGLAAQSTGAKASFMGLPIESRIDDFGKSLKEKGFKLALENEKGLAFYGKFLGYDVETHIMNNEVDKDLVCAVAVFIPAATWSEAESLLNQMSDLYSRKYGKPLNRYLKLRGLQPDTPEFHQELGYGRTGQVSCYTDFFADDVQIGLDIMNAPNWKDAGGYRLLINYVNLDVLERSKRDPIEDI